MPRITKGSVTAAESGSRWGVRSERTTAPLLVFLLFGLPLFFVLNERDLGNDEAIYAFAVDTMLQDGEWLTPKGIYAGHHPFFEKPPLMFWLTALPIQLGALPHNEFGYRFWPALFASLSFLYVYAIGRRIGGTVCGVAAALFLFTRRDLLLDHGLGQYVMEAPLVLAYAAGAFHFLSWTDATSPRSRFLHILALGAAFSLGFMTKFVAVLLLPIVLGVSALCVTAWRTRLIEDLRHWLLVIALIATLVTPWFLFQYLEHGSAFWNDIFGKHVVTRLTSHLDPDHLRPAPFYLEWLGTSWYRSGAWLFVLTGAFLTVVRIRAARGSDAILLWLWLVIPLILLSAMTSKLGHYFYPFLAPCALTAGLAVAWLAGELEAPKSPLPKRVQMLLARQLGAKLRLGLALTGLLCLTAAVATALQGGLALEIGGWLRIHNHSVLRPLVLGICIAANLLINQFRWLLLTLVLIPTIFSYTAILDNLGETRRPLGTLQACLSDQARDGEISIVSLLPEGTPRTHPVFYYGVEGRPVDAGLADLTKTPAWMLEPTHRELASGIPAYRMPGAWVHARGGNQMALITFPSTLADCAGLVEAAGAERLR